MSVSRSLSLCLVVLLLWCGCLFHVSLSAKWVRVTSQAAWSPRAGGVVELYPGPLKPPGSATINGPMFIMHGLGVDDPGTVEERTQIWYSAGAVRNRGVVWEQLYPNTVFSPLLSSLTVLDNSKRMFRFFGCTNPTTRVPVNEVWMSSNAVDWQALHLVPNAVFPPARYHGVVVADKSNNLIMIGGRTPALLSDVWRSPSGGTRWTLMTANVPWGARGVNMAVTTTYTDPESGEPLPAIYAIAGWGPNTGARYQNDVWLSINNGKYWSLITEHAGWAARANSQVEITSQGVMILSAGFVANNAPNPYLNDVWASLDGGWTWGLCVEDAEFSDRRDQYTVLEDGVLYVMGGFERANSTAQPISTNDVWKSNFGFDDIQAVAEQCHLPLPSCGRIGLSCLPSNNPELNPDLYRVGGVYYVSCAACPFPFKNGDSTNSTHGSGSSNTPLIISLVVFVLVSVIAVTALMYTYCQLKRHGVDIALTLQSPKANSNSIDTSAFIPLGADPLHNASHTTINGNSSISAL